MRSEAAEYVVLHDGEASEAAGVAQHLEHGESTEILCYPRNQEKPYNRYHSWYRPMIRIEINLIYINCSYNIYQEKANMTELRIMKIFIICKQNIYIRQFSKFSVQKVSGVQLRASTLSLHPALIRTHSENQHSFYNEFNIH